MRVRVSELNIDGAGESTMGGFKFYSNPCRTTHISSGSTISQ